jgi:hypothetical protein
MTDPGGYAGENVSRRKLAWDIFKVNLFVVLLLIIGLISWVWIEICQVWKNIRKK